MSLVRAIVYRLGFNPRPGSIFFSPSRALLRLSKEARWP